MADKEQLAILKQGVNVWNEWRKKNPGVKPDLRGESPTDRLLKRLNSKDLESDLHKANLVWANLSDADLTGSDLSEADLSGATLTRANLSRADLREANLYWANLPGAILAEAGLTRATLSAVNLSQADFTAAYLEGATLIGSDLRGASFKMTILDGADFSKAILGPVIVATKFNEVIAVTSFNDVDLSNVKGLETVHHDGPSTIGIDTIYKSKGKIPEAFLRKCGVPNEMIEFARTVSQEFHSCFISYSSKDEEFVKRLYADLQSRGVRVWFAPEDLKIGDKFRTRIDEAIRVYDKLLLVLSENSISSDWVEKEVEAAFEKERQQKRTMLFPVRLDDAVMQASQAWAADIRRTRHIGDMSKWKDHDSYQKAVERLIRDLQATQDTAET